MSFIVKNQGHAFEAGWFLAHDENCVRKTQQIAQSGAKSGDNGEKYVPMGTVWPANDATAVGIVYEDVDVTTGDMPGSVVMAGTVYEDRLPVALETTAKTALEASGFVFIAQSPAITRPY